ncbi:late embryogenesis abundant protein D-34, partial [Trifolium medium]|nr:late embryogenesis abundant protein D-34 [Trifolium medium]
MQSAAAVNAAVGLVNRNDMSDIAKNQGVAVLETKVGGNRVITESVGSQIVGQFVEPDVPMNDPGLVL